MPPLSGKQRKAQLKLKRAIKRGDAPPSQEQPQKRKKKGPGARNLPDRATISARNLQSQFVKLDKAFLDETRALAGSIVLRRPIHTNVIVLRHEWITPFPSQSELPPLAVPKRPKWKYQMSKEELDANEQAYFRTWLAQQDAIVEQWQRALSCPPSTVRPTAPTDLVGDHADDSETHPMPHPPTHFERNIEVWRQFWRVTEISQILLVLLDSRCPPLHLPPPLSTHLDIPTSSPPQNVPSPRSRQSKSKAPRIILVLTKVDISGPARTASWTSFLNANYPGIPVVPVEAYAPKSTVEQGPTRYEPHLPSTFRERLVHTLRDVHEQLLQPPLWVTAPRPGEREEGRLQRMARWKPKVKKVIDWDGVLRAEGKQIGKAVGGAAVPRGQDVEHGTEVDEGDDFKVSDSEAEQTDDAYEWEEPEFLTVGVIGHPNVGKSSLLNAIFGKTRVRASRTPGKTKHFQTLFWTSDVRLVDCPGLIMPSFVPMDIQVLSGVLPISRISAVPFCVHQLARFLPLEQILGLTHPSLSISPTPNPTATVTSTSDRGSSKYTSNAKSKSKPAPASETLVEDKRTWRPGQRPLEQTKAQSQAPRWTANDIMTAYANKKGWVTAKAGRPDIHRAGNAILRLVAEGRIPWGFWPPGSLISSEDGIWLKDGVQQHVWGELEMDKDSDGEEDSEEPESEMEELASEEEDTMARIKAISGGSDDKDEDKDNERPAVLGGNLGRFGALRTE